MSKHLDWTRAKRVPTITREDEAKREAATDAEFADFQAMLSAKKPGMRAFVAAKNHPGQTVVLYGSAGDWKRGVCCRLADHRARAEAYAAAFNAAGIAPKAEKPAAAKGHTRGKAAKVKAGNVTYPAAGVVIETGRTDLPWD